MAIARCILALLPMAFLLMDPSSLYGQGQFKMKVYLGPRNELEVDAEYRDPSDIDAKLNGTRVIPIWLSVRNNASQPIPLDYRDWRLDLGSAASTTPLSPVDGDTARKMLQQDGRYNAILSFLNRQGNDYAGDPFSIVLPDGTLKPRGAKKGYVFFLRPDGVPFTGFMALATTSYVRGEILPTTTIEVRAPPTEAESFWTSTWLRNKWGTIVNGPPPFNKSYALLMGVSDYKYLNKLLLVNADLDKMEKFLLSHGFHVVRVQNANLTVANVRSPQDYFADKITSNDRLLVYFAGHGIPRMEGGEARGYLALMNAREGDVSRENTIAMDEFVAWADRVAAKHLLVLLDSCFSGRAVRGPGSPLPKPDVKLETRGASVPDAVRLYDLANKSGRFLLMAGNETQESIASREMWGGGLFTQAVVKGLGGDADTVKDGFVTTRELYTWLRNYVADEAHKTGKTLTPLIKDLDSHVSEGEFVFTASR